MRDIKDKDEPLSASSVTLQLSLIQKRCNQLLEDEELGLSLEDAPDPKQAEDAFNPYNRG